MFSTLKKLRPKKKDKKSKRKEKKDQDKQAGSQNKRPSLPGSAFHLDADTHAHPALPAHSTARRHSCFPAFQQPGASEKGRRPSLSSRRSSVASTCSAEGLRVKRLIEIAQLDKYIEHLKKSVDDNNISYIPNRLCCVQLLKSVLQRRERQYVYEYLHSNRSSSESDISIKSRESETKVKHSVTFSDDNNNNDNTTTNTTHGSRDVVDNLKFIGCRDNDCHERLDNRNRTASDCQESEEEERVPGALLKAYDSDGTRHSAGSDTDSDDTRKYRKKRSSSKSRRGSIALFPQNFEIF